MDTLGTERNRALCRNSPRISKYCRFCLLLSHVGDCMQNGEVWQKAKDHYKDAAARWHLLKSYDNEALANLKIAAIDEKLNEDPTTSYEAALRASKPNGSLLTTCIVEKQYADYLWKHGGAVQAILLKLDYLEKYLK